MYQFYGKINREQVSRPLYRDCPLFGGSVIRGFTVHQLDNKFGYHIHHAGNCSYKQRTTGSETKTYKLLAKIKTFYHFQGSGGLNTVFSLEIANQVVQRCKLPLVVLVSALYGLGQLSDCTMNIIIAIQTEASTTEHQYE